VAGTGLPESGYRGAGALGAVMGPLALAVAPDGSVVYADDASDRFRVLRAVPY
jgi:hypothetical protein